MKRHQIIFLASKNLLFGIEKNYLALEYQKSFVFVYFVYSWMDGLGSLRQALWVAWNRPNLTEAMIWRPGGAQTLRTL